VFIQSFEPASLEILRPLTRARLVLLTSDPAAVTPAALEAAKAYADGLGVEKRLVLPVADDGRVQAPTSLVAQAHAAGLFVHVWTLRREADFLPAEYAGDLGAEARRFFAAGVDGIFTDFPDLVIAARPALR
jgi:glycerophosphoryl diester phosphodiesterase